MDWDSHSDFSFVHLLQENASGDETKDCVFLLFNCAWPEEDAVNLAVCMLWGHGRVVF